MVFLPNRWQLGFFERRVTFFPKASLMLGFSFSCLTAWGASCFERWCADGVGARERKGKEGKGRERKGKEGKGRERKGKEGKGRERKGKEGKGRERKAVAGNGSGEEATGDERAWLCGRLRMAWVQGEEATGDERAWLRGRLQTAWCK